MQRGPTMAGPDDPDDPRPKRRGRRGETTEAERRLWREAMRDVTPLEAARPEAVRKTARKTAAGKTRERLADRPLPTPPENRAIPSAGSPPVQSEETPAPEPSFAEILRQSLAPAGDKAQKTLAKRKAAAGTAVKRPARPSPHTPPFSDFRVGAEDMKPPPPAGLDRRSADRLRRGRMEIEARLDLHGLTQAAAQPALEAFLAKAQRRGLRCVLVITGKGRSGEDPGVLRRMVPRWLAEPPNSTRVLALAPARVQHGGGGALYVLLRRLRG